MMMLTQLKFTLVYSRNSNNNNGKAVLFVETLYLTD